MKKAFFVVVFIAVLGILFNSGAPSAKAMTVAEIQTLIAQLQQQIAALQKQLTEVQGTTAVWCHNFNTNLKYGDSGDEVNALQTVLMKEGFELIRGETQIPNFGEYTASAVTGFQEKYKSEILSPSGLRNGTGYAGPATRAKLNKLYGCVTTPVCIQVITPAKNSSTGECKNFSTPCDVPTGWTKVDSCPISTTPYITVISPNGGEQWVIGNTYSVKIYCSQGISKVLNISLINYATGGGETEIAHEVTCSLGYTSAYEWKIPSFITAGSQFKVVAKTIDNSISDQSDNYFSIVSPVTAVTCTDSDKGQNYYTKGTTVGLASDNIISTDTDYCSASNQLVEWFCLAEFNGVKNAYRTNTNYPCAYGCQNGACQRGVTVASPNGGEQWETGETHTIWWTSAGYTQSVYVTLAIRDGRYDVNTAAGEITIVSNILNTGSYNWTIPSTISAGSFYKIAIYIDGGGTAQSFDLSNNNFQITQAIACTDSDGGQNYYVAGKGTGLYSSNKETGVIWGENPNKSTARFDTSMNYSISYDHCVDSVSSNQLNEAYCKEDGTLSSYGYPCPYGCKDGACKPGITVVSPNGGESFERGKTYNITWNTGGYSSADKVRVAIVDYSSTINAGEYDIAYNLAANNLGTNAGFYSWTVPASFNTGNNYKIKVEICGSTGCVSDLSDGYINITYGVIGMNYMENQLADISKAISNLIEQIGALGR